MVDIDKADEIPASLVIEKGKEFQKAMAKFLEETKEPRKCRSLIIQTRSLSKRFHLSYSTTSIGLWRR